jgi:aldose 1-epimerase
MSSVRSTDQVHPYSITDEATGTSANILTGVGFNCFAFQPVVDSTPIDVIWAEEGYGLESAVDLNGIPLLFPFAGRLAGDTFSWEGETYRVTGALTPDGNVIHGFVLSRPWRVIEQTTDAITGEFQVSVDDPSLLDQWPADFLIRVTYRVAGASLNCDVRIENPGERPLPFGFGTHPYFRLPLGGDDRAGCIVTLPAAEQWRHDSGLPTGERVPVPAAVDAREGRASGDVVWDGVYTGLETAADGLVHTTIDDPVSGIRVEQSFEPKLRNCVVWAPPHGEALAVEPWSTVPNAFALIEQGIDPGLIVLPPGERWETRIKITASQR